MKKDKEKMPLWYIEAELYCGNEHRGQIRESTRAKTIAQAIRFIIFRHQKGDETLFLDECDVLSVEEPEIHLPESSHKKPLLSHTSAREKMKQLEMFKIHNAP